MHALKKDTIHCVLDLQLEHKMMMMLQHEACSNEEDLPMPVGENVRNRRTLC